jgi:enoyl-CoA hydratase/carnithine racemase
MGKYVTYEKEDKISIITINHPPVNALDPKTIKELKEAFDELEMGKEIQVAIITGGGEKAFVAGADITVFPQLDQKGGEALSLEIHEAFNTIDDSEMVVIAAINGLALGGGCELALACDIRIASKDAKLGQPEVNLALIPGAGGTQRLPRLVGPGKAKVLIFTGDMISADEAKEIGLVDKVVDSGTVIDEAKRMAEKILTKGSLAIQAAKRAINRGLDLPLKEALVMEARVFGELFNTKDQKEGARAFLEKRLPKFMGK